MNKKMELLYSDSAVVVMWSCCVVATVMIVAQILRFFLKMVTNLDAQTWRILDEFSGFVQFSTVLLELRVVDNLFGTGSWISYAAVFTTMAVKTALFIQNGLIGIPTTFVGLFYINQRQRNYTWAFAIMIIVAQLCGSLLAHPITRLLWGSVYSEFHNKQVLHECHETLEVSLLHGCGIEFLACLIYSIVDWQCSSTQRPFVRPIICILLGNLFHKTTGVWMHSILATAHTYGCTGSKGPYQHILVYWIAPFVSEFFFFEMLMLKRKLFDNAPADKSSKVQSSGVKNGASMNGSKVTPRATTVRQRKSS